MGDKHDDKLDDDRSIAIPSGGFAAWPHGRHVWRYVNMVVNGAAQLGKGQRPVMKDLLLTPKKTSPASPISCLHARCGNENRPTPMDLKAFYR
jgi:hypothetical protein